MNDLLKRTPLCAFIISSNLLCAEKVEAYYETEHSMGSLKTKSINLVPPVKISQFRIIKGKITDEAGAPMPGVSVMEKGTFNGTATDRDGLYQLKAGKEDAVLVFSFVGYITREISAGAQSVIDVSLEPDSKKLEEVVVVGYQTQKKIDLTSAVDKLDPQTISAPTGSISNNLAGRLSGVVGVQGNGEPGANSANFYIRGLATFTGNNKPLVLVDGIERPIDRLDPNEIESFTILKDATATAVFGARGANGVVVINTKRGKQADGRASIGLRLENGFTTPTNMAKLADGVTYMKLQNEALINAKSLPIFSQDKIDKTAGGTADPYYYPNTDWMKQMIKSAAFQQHAVFDVNGGGEKAQYYAMLSYLNQDGMFNNAKEHSYDNNINYKRYNVRTNFDMDITGTTKLSLTLGASLENKNSPTVSRNEIFRWTVLAAPTWFPPSYPDPAKTPGRRGVSNPWQLLANSGYKTDYNSILNSNAVVIQKLDKFIKGLSIKYQFGFDSYSQAALSRSVNPRKYLIEPFADATGAPRTDAQGNPVLQDSQGDYNYVDQDPSNSGYHDHLTLEGSRSISRNIYNELSMYYGNTFGAAHSVSGLVLYNRNDNLDPSNADIFGSIPKRRQGLSARATYVFNSKYIAEFNMGYNGSENYAAGKKFGFFPAYAIGWVTSSEEFFKPLLKYISLVKIRVTSGTVGNDQIDNRFSYLTRVAGTSTNIGFGTNNGYGYGHGSGVNITYFGNPDATWEESQKSDLGIEIAFLNGFRVNGDLFYEKRTKIWDQLTKIPSLYGYGDKIPSGNVGEMENKGFDGSLEYFRKVNNKLTIQFKGTFLWSKNTILKSGAVTPKYPYQSWIGRSSSDNMGYIAQGLFKDQNDVDGSPNQSTLGGQYGAGDIKYKDLNADGKIDQFDRTFIGYPRDVPRISFGAGASVTYMNVDFNFLFSGSGQTSFMPMPKSFVDTDRGNVYQAVADDHWSAENQNLNAAFPKLGTGRQDNNYQTSTFWQKDGSYVRLKQAEIGYSFNAKFLKQSKIFESFRLYLTGVNLLAFSKFTWWDPESQNTSGVYYPVQKLVNFGFNARF